MYVMCNITYTKIPCCFDVGDRIHVLRPMHPSSAYMYIYIYMYQIYALRMVYTSYQGLQKKTSLRQPGYEARHCGGAYLAIKDIASNDTAGIYTLL